MEWITIIVLVPLGILLVIPRNWLPVVTLALVATSTALWMQEKSCTSCDTGLGGALVMFTLMVISAGVLVALIIRVVWAMLRPAADGTLVGHTPLSRAGLYALAAGLVALLLTGFGVAAASGAIDSGLGVHLAVSVWAIVWFVLLSHPWLISTALGPGSWLQPARVMKYAGLLTIIGAMGWSLSIPASALAAADSAAEGRSYCLQVASPRGLRNVRNKFDLSGFMMRAGHESLRHSLLAVGESESPGWMYWSYGRGAFVQEFMGGVLRCELQPQYARSQHWFGNGTASEAREAFWLASRKWSIPDAFHGSANDKPARLRFYAEGKNFEALSAPVWSQGRQSWSVIELGISASLCTPKKLHVWQVAQDDPNYQVEPAGSEAGLQKLAVNSKTQSQPEIHMVDRDASGAIRTWILCGDAKCRHAFMRDGIVLEFMHSKSELASWKKLQDALWVRLMSFALNRPTTPITPCEKT